MSRVLYILGNGFDLFNGYKTKYSDFMNEKLLDNNKKSYMDLKLEIKKITENSEMTDIIKQRIIEILTPYSLFVSYLLLLDLVNEEDYLWCNVEGELKNYLEFMYYAFEYYNRWKVSESDWKFSTGISFASNLKKTKTMFKDIFDFYSTIFQIMYNKKIELKKQLMDDLNSFEKEFGDYIKNKTKDKIGNILEFESMLRNFFESEKESVVINFNYSQYLKHFFNNITFVHGTYEEPIFGIDYTEGSMDLISFTKTARIMNNNTINENFNLPKKEHLEKIVFFGHSLSEADYSYFQSIFDYYNIYDSNIKLEFRYSQYGNFSEDEIRKFEVDKVMKLLSVYGNTLDNKDKGKNLIHKLNLEKRIVLKLFFNNTLNYIFNE